MSQSNIQKSSLKVNRWFMNCVIQGFQGMSLSSSERKSLVIYAGRSYWNVFLEHWGFTDLSAVAGVNGDFTPQHTKALGVCVWKCVMDWLMSPPTFKCWSLIPNVAVFGDEIFKEVIKFN